MRPVHDHAPGLFPNPVEQLQVLSSFVIQRGLVGFDSACRELEREFADEFTYVEVGARRESDRTRVLLEFGVKYHAEHHCEGFVDAYLDDANQEIGQIIAVIINGQPVSIDAFMARLQPMMGLPLVHTEIAETLA